LKNLVRERYSRNEAIVQVLADMGYIERMGYGIDRMLRTMKEQGHEPPVFAETEKGFMVTLFSKRPIALGGATQNPQVERMQKVLNFLREKGRITNREYAELAPDVSAESLRRDFVELVEKNLIMRVGDKRGTYYILK
jgi:ATP-dependent DNA helicase RecG